MRRLFLALPLCIPLCAHAQQAANPVEPFSYGVRTGTPQNPIVAALSSVVPSAHAGSTQAAAPVELFSYGRRVGTQSNPLYINLGNALDSYVTQVSLTSTLSAYLTTAAAASTYLPLSGGTVQNLTVAASFTPPSMTYAQASASTCTAGQIVYVTDGQKFWGTSDYSSGSGSSIYPANGSGQAGGFYGCVPGASGNPTFMPLLMNYYGGPR